MGLTVPRIAGPNASDPWPPHASKVPSQGAPHEWTDGDGDWFTSSGHAGGLA